MRPRRVIAELKSDAAVDGLGVRSTVWCRTDEGFSTVENGDQFLWKAGILWRDGGGISEQSRLICNWGALSSSGMGWLADVGEIDSISFWLKAGNRLVPAVVRRKQEGY